MRLSLAMLSPMRFIVSSALLGLVAGFIAVAAEAEPHDAKASLVAELDASKFDNFIKEQKVTLVEFFAPWCGHCQRLEPEYKKAAQELKSFDIKIASIDCVKHANLCSERGIRGYPTLKLFKGGQEEDYKGPRDSAGIVKHMKKQMMPAVSKIDPKDLDTFAQSDDVVVVAVFDHEHGQEKEKEEKEKEKEKDETKKKEEEKKDGKTMAQAFQQIAEELRNEHTFGALPAGIYMFKKFDERFAKYDGSPTDIAAIRKWISTESTPLMAEVTPENYAKYVGSGLPMAYLFYNTEAMRKEYGSLVETAIREYKGRLNAVYIDANKFDRHAEALTLPKKWPGFVIHEVEDDVKYPFLNHEGFNADNMRQFLKDYFGGKLEPTFRSEEIPEKDEGPIRTVVFKNFDKIVMDETKDVLLEIYAPWCGACKRIAPVYEKVAKKYAPHSSKIVIAKMDGTANDIPKSAGIKLTKFPTLLLFKAGKAGTPKEMVEFERAGDSVKAFVDFIQKQATNKVEVTVEAEAEADGDGKDHDEL